MNVVYLMMDEKKNYALFKPGFASNLEKRMAHYTTHNPEVRCISYIKTMEKSKHWVEGLFHKEFAERGYERLYGTMNGTKTEWFRVSYDDPFYTELCEFGLCAFKCGKNRKNYGEFIKQGLDNSQALCYNHYRKREKEITKMKVKVNKRQLPKEICFDMDGTIADLYAVENWLPKLRAEDVSPYLKAQPMWDMEELAETLRQLQALGVVITVITWLSKDSSAEYKKAVRQAKREWLAEQGFPFDHFHGVQYGATKADSVRKFTDNAWLIDDNAKVRNGWHLGEAIDPTACNLIEILKNLVE